MSGVAVQAALVLVGVLLYLRYVRRGARAGAAVPAARIASFTLGACLIFAAVIAGQVEEEWFFLHMLQHVVLGDIGALLIVIGLPAWRGTTIHPALPFLVWAGALAVWHVPGPYEAALGSPAVHVVQHVSFFVAGALVWAVILGRLESPAWFGEGTRVAAVAAVQVVGMALAQLFIWATVVIYPSYEQPHRGLGLDAITDQRLGGVVMAVEGSLVASSVFAWLFLRWMGNAEPAGLTGAGVRRLE